MDSRKNDTERVINLLKLYKGRLNKPDEKGLKKVMETLIEGLKSPLYNALLDIQEWYDYSLNYPLNVAPAQIEQVKEVTLFESQASTEKPQSEKIKKTKRNITVDEQDNVVTKTVTTTQYSVELPRNEPKYQYEEPLQELPQDFPFEQDEPDYDQNKCLYFDLVLSKGKGSYGFAIAGGFDKNHYEGDSSIYVTKIIPGGAAAKNGQLKIGDAIVSVNETNLEYVIHQTAVETLKNAGKSMALVIRRLKEDYSDTNDNTNLDDYPAENREQESLGLYNPPIEQQTDQEQTDDEQFQQFEITLVKKPGAGLGFSVQGGYDVDIPEESTFVSVSRLTPGGVADVDGRLQLGDFLLMVDDQPLNGVTHDESVSLLKNTGRNVKLLVGRFLEVLPEPSVEKSFQPEEHVVEKSERKKKKKRRQSRDDD